MRETIASIEREYRRYKTLAESTFAVLTAGQLAEVAGVDGNSIAVIVWHVLRQPEVAFHRLPDVRRRKGVATA